MIIHPFTSEDGQTVARFEVAFTYAELADAMTRWLVDQMGDTAEGFVAHSLALHPTGAEIDIGAEPSFTLTIAPPLAPSMVEADAAPCPLAAGTEL